MKSKKRILSILNLSLHLFIAVHLPAQTNSAKQIVGKYRNLFTVPPSKIPGNVAIDGPLLGNGFSAVAIAGSPERQNYYLARNDFWRLKSGFNTSFPAVLGNLVISIPALTGASYRVEQRLYNATTISDFRKENVAVQIESVLAATKDWLLIDIFNTGKTSIAGNATLELPQTRGKEFADTLAHGSDKNGVQWIQRGFIQDVDIKTMAAAALKISGSASSEFSISPGQKITLICILSGNFKSADCLKEVQKQTKEATISSIEKTKRQHAEWWRSYWNESFVNIGDSVIEHQYYRSQYNMASCSRDPKFPPGIFGSWITQEIPAWNGDYHLNYNYSAPFYALFSSNHLQQLLPYESPLIDFMLRGKYYSAKLTAIPDGILYPVGIGPLGIETTRQANDSGLFYGQKSNAAYCAAVLCMEFYRTFDTDFTKRVYPYVKQVAVFWQHYLKKENGRYIIENDAIHEGTYGTINPILSLGLVPMVLKTAIDMSVLLGVDKNLRSDWQEKADHIAGYTLQVRNGKTVFRYSEKGTNWWPDNTLGIQHIYPAGAIGLNSDTNLLGIAHNTITEMHRWRDYNGSNSFFPAAVRVGYNADTIWNQLRLYSLHTYPNGFQKGNPHGIENCSTVPNTINEMLCMSNQNLLRVFEVWPKERDASFFNVRCEGAFLVSSVLKNRAVQFVKIFSERGRVCVLQNPWPGKMILVKSNKRTVLKKSGEHIELHTLKGEKLMITEVGISSSR